MSINPELKNLYTNAVLKSEVLEKFRKCFEDKKIGCSPGRPKMKFQTDEEKEEHIRKVQFKAKQAYYYKRKRDKTYERIKREFDELEPGQQIKLINELIKQISV